MAETKVPPRKIKVVDRRKFTSEGDPRPDSAASRDTNAPDQPRPASPGPPPHDEKEQTRQEPRTPASPKRRSDESSSRFLELVAMLAGQAELLLVGAEGFPAQPSDAQRLIDYLGELESKTAGNLSEEESQVLSKILYQLRSLFLQKTS